MTNILETVVDALAMSNDEKEPVHVGEAMNLWIYMTMIDEASVYIQMGLNTTTDDELRSSLEESLRQCNSQSDRLRSFMLKEGIPLPPTSEQKPASNPSAIPLGVKMTDDEISNGVGIKTASAIVFCATGAAQAIRNDVGLLWTQFQAEKLKYGVTLKKLMKEKGWIKQPPFFVPPGYPVQ